MTQLDLLAYSERPRVADVRLRRSATARGEREELSIEERFSEFRAQNPHVISELLRLSRARLDRGEKRIGVKALWEELRATLSVAHSGEYKLNNSYTAPAARLLIELEPRLDGVIELRRRKNGGL